MLEKEIKILEINKSQVIDTLVDLGAQKTFEGKISDTYYDFMDRVQYKQQEADRIFRLRTKGSKSIYTVKERKIPLSKDEQVFINEEYEIEILDIQTFIKILAIQGMVPIREKQKYRVSYALGNMKFDLDSYQGIPEFLEIEGPSGKAIHEWISKLSLEKNEQLIGGSRIIFDRYKVPYTYCD